MREFETTVQELKHKVLTSVARLAWEDMAKFIKADPDLGELFTVKDYKSVIEATETGCTMEALSREAGLDDGFRSIFCSVDEIHQHKDNKVYKALYNGTRSLPETLVSMITTRGGVRLLFETRLRVHMHTQSLILSYSFFIIFKTVFYWCHIFQCGMSSLSIIKHFDVPENIFSYFFHGLVLSSIYFFLFQ